VKKSSGREPKIVAIGLAKPDDEVVRQARAILKLAEEGTLRSLLWAGDMVDHVKTGFTAGMDTFMMIGHLERLKHRMMIDADMRTEREDDE